MKVEKKNSKIVRLLYTLTVCLFKTILIKLFKKSNQYSLLGLLKSQHLIASAHPSDEASLKAFQNLGATAVTENHPVVERSEIIFISVKPNVVKSVLEDVKSISSAKLFVSIAMGIGIKEIEEALPNDTRVIRVMPNTPAIVQAACSCLVKGKSATNDDVDVIKKLFEKIGTCEEVTDGMIDAITALSGSGPAYVCDVLLMIL